ncbi:MAG: hypothetical protein VB030_09535 [Eubacterium aggregans]|uniref:Uncharacterized protein n=1 Tax=Eubacterium aggregans TaxID=81409 RepID=A0A1H4DK60_9FIRM|nr:hypothetical protein [Eubacterium aggregans]MDD4691793.1 hypothetical protein [Eubacterium aggregans]MEA5074404.1 hypothetical protein [Eubacterium aggregans]SEA73161.1 hypothetical protein SAMN04515656_12531 [Eubacterium aggregans]
MESLYEFKRTSSFQDYLLSVKYLNKVLKLKKIFIFGGVLLCFLNLLLSSLLDKVMLSEFLFRFFIDTIIIILIGLLFFIPIEACLLFIITRIFSFLRHCSTKYYTDYIIGARGKKLEYQNITGYFENDQIICFHSQQSFLKCKLGFARKENIVKGDYEEFLQFINKKIEESGAKQIIL